MPTAMKRKLEVLESSEEEDAQLTSIDARRSILDISMLKLRSAPPGAPLHRKVEPSLRRSVLIFNTLKHLEAQLKREGVCVPVGQVQQELLPVIEDNSDVVLESAPPTGVPSLATGSIPCGCVQGSNCVPLVTQGQLSPTLGSSDSNALSTLQNCNNQTFVPPSTCQCTAKTGSSLIGAVDLPNLPSLVMPHVECNTSHRPVSNATNVIGTGQLAISTTTPSVPSCYHANTQAPVNMAPAQYQPVSTCQSGYSCIYNQKGAYSCSHSMSVTESLFSNTSKMLDSLLTNDKIATAATNFSSSLFELDNLGSNTIPEPVSSYSNVSQSNAHIWGTPEPATNTALTVPVSGQDSVWGSGLTPTVVRNEPMATECNTDQWSATTSTYQELRSPSPAVVQSLSVGMSSNTTLHDSCLTPVGGATTPSVVTSCSSVFQPNPVPSPPSLTLSATSPVSSGALQSPVNIERSSPLTCRQECDAVVSATAVCSNDIDCNMFDFDMFMPSLSPSMRLTPLNHDDLLHSLPSTESPSFSPTPWSPKSEYIADDLDHIMQILVGL